MYVCVNELFTYYLSGFLKQVLQDAKVFWLRLLQRFAVCVIRYAFSYDRLWCGSEYKPCTNHYIFRSS